MQLSETANLHVCVALVNIFYELMWLIFIWYKKTRGNTDEGFFFKWGNTNKRVIMINKTSNYNSMLNRWITSFKIKPIKNWNFKWVYLSNGILGCGMI